MAMQNSLTVDQVRLFDAIEERIRDQIAEFKSPNTCYLVIDPDEFELPERQTLCLTIAPHAGEFDQGVFDGGGDDAILERSGFTVTIWSNIKLDRPDEKSIALNHASRGLVPLKKKLLKALAGFMPTDEDTGAPLLTDYIAPVAAGFPAVPRKNCITLSVSFSLNWAWDLS